MNDKAKKLLEHLNRLATETSNPKSVHIDRLSAVDICRLINDEDQTVAAVVRGQAEAIAKAAELAADRLRRGGRLFYIGAGTSGRLGVLDAAEIPPTFGADPAQVIGIIAGGHATLVLSAEGVEDRAEEAPRDLQAHHFSASDMLIGLAASIKTPYTISGIKYAHEIKATTGLIVCNRAEGLDFTPDVLIELDVGPEIITGSTRMKSGTAQKMTLNMISTAAMILLGKCYGNLMVDLKATSNKLKARSRKILMELLGVTYEQADQLLAASGGSVKVAIVMHRLGLDRTEALRRLDASGGFLWRLLDVR